MYGPDGCVPTIQGERRREGMQIIEPVGVLRFPLKTYISEKTLEELRVFKRQ
jgi:hypothetical protein